MTKKKIPPPNFTAIPNCLFPIFSEMKEAELRVILVVCRETFGWHRQEKEFSLSQLMIATGMGRQGTHNGITDGIEHGLLGRKPAGQSFIYFLNMEEPELVHQVDQSTKETSPLSRPELVHQVDRPSPLSRPVAVHQVDQRSPLIATKSNRMRVPKESIKKEIKKGNKSSARTHGARRRNDFSDAFCTAYARLHLDELKYKPITKDFVQLAGLRETAEQDAPGWLNLARWHRAIDNYFASSVANPTLADLAVRFRVFYKSPLDKYGKAIISDAVPVKLPGCEICLNDPVRIRTKTEPGMRFDSSSKSFVPCLCNPIGREKGNGKSQEQRPAATIQ